MTDKEIIKAFYTEEVSKEQTLSPLFWSVYDLINRQQAEIEKLVNIPPKDPIDFCGVVCNYAEELIKTAKSEAYKEFGERLKDILDKSLKKYSVNTNSKIKACCEVLRGVKNEIDNLLKEMG